jgi:hypothetical protein
MANVNGRPLAALVYALCDVSGHLGGALPERAVVPLANGAGVFGSTVTVSPRDITVGLDVRPVTLADRAAVVDTIQRRLAGLLEFSTDDVPGRVRRVELLSVTPEWYTGRYANPAVYLVLQFRAADPAAWDVVPRVLGLSTARTACPVGTATSGPVVELYGPCVNPAAVLRAHTGAEVARLEFATTLGVDDALVADCARNDIVRTVAGVVQTGALSGAETLAAASRLLVLDPEHGAPDGSASPTLELTAQGGTPTGLVTYFRRW